MSTLRQLAGGLVYAVIALLLVIGAVALSLAQGRGGTLSPSPAVPSASPATLTRPPAPASPNTATSSAASTNVPQPSPSRIPSSASAAASQTASTSRPTSAPRASCGAPAGWIRAYVVQPGDTLYHIATTYGITVSALQRANCRTGTLIYAGENLWVPFMPPPPTQLTIIPTFPSPTEPAPPEATVTPDVTQTVDP